MITTLPRVCLLHLELRLRGLFELERAMDDGAQLPLCDQLRDQRQVARVISRSRGALGASASSVSKRATTTCALGTVLT